MSQNTEAVRTDAAGIDHRYPASAVPSITALRLSPGDTVDLVNISRSGVLVQGRTRLVPGTRVTMSIEGGFRPAQLKGRVVRCQVCSISAGALQYESGIQFDGRLETEPADGGASAARGSATPAIPSLPATPTRRAVNRW